VIKISYWKNKKFSEPEIEFVNVSLDGTPTLLKIPDWENIKSMTYTNEDGIEFTGEYIKTSRGWLRIDSIRLKRALKPFVGKKGTLTIQKWCEGKDMRSTICKVKLEPVQTSLKKPKPKPK